MMIKEKSMQVAKIHAFVEESRQKAEPEDEHEDMREMFKKFVQVCVGWRWLWM